MPVFFRDVYSRADFDDYAEKYAKYRNQDESTRGKTPESEVVMKEWLHGVAHFEAKILEFLRAKRDANELEPIPFIEGRGLRWGDAWNRFVSNNEGITDEFLLQRQAQAESNFFTGAGLFPMAMTFVERQDGVQISMDERFESLMAMVDSGKMIKPQSAHGGCDVTGARLFVDIAEGWKVQFGSMGSIDGQQAFFPLKEHALPLGVQHVTIPCPTGELLCTDWLDIDAFNKAVKRDLRLPSLDLRYGVMDATRHYAKNGFASVSVGNTSPDLIQRGDQLVIASTDLEAPANKDKVGAFCTDRWWATLIDRQVLTEIVAKTTGLDEARRQVQEMIDERDMMTVNVKPGVDLHLYHFNGDDIIEGHACEDVDTEHVETLYAVLSEKELEWSPKVAAKVRPRP
jgi:hypothetical protein